MRRAALLAAIAALFALVSAAPAHALLDPADAAELANALADARTEQDVCYGWDVSGDQVDVGSSEGPGQPVDPGTCERYVVLQVSIDYACGSCESSDTANFTVVSNLPNPPTTGDLKDLGYDNDDLLGDKDDEAVFNMTEALPLLTAEKGGAEFIPYEPATNVPAADKATNSPGSDFMRDNWLGLIVFALLVLLGPVFWLVRRSQDRKKGKWHKRADGARPTAQVATAGGATLRGATQGGKKTWSPTPTAPPPPPTHGAPPPPAQPGPPPPPPGDTPPTNDPTKE